MGAFCCHQFKSKSQKFFGRLYNLDFIPVIYGNQSLTRAGESNSCSLLSLEKSYRMRFSNTHYLTGSLHLRTQYRVKIIKHVKGKNRFLNTTVRYLFLFKIKV